VFPRIVRAVPLSLVLLPASASADPVDFAARQIGRPYVWGAEGPNAFDCSGLTQYVYQRFGVDLPRRAISQSKVGDLIGRGLQRGDLLFFSTDSRQSTVTHVGIYEGGGVMIEASKRYGRVRRDRIDDAYWVERFMFARRIAADPGAVVLARRPEPRDPRRRRTAVRIVERLADILIRRPGR